MLGQLGFRFGGTLTGGGGGSGPEAPGEGAEPGRRGWRWAGPRDPQSVAPPFQPALPPAALESLVSFRSPLGVLDSRGLFHVQ